MVKQYFSEYFDKNGDLHFIPKYNSELESPTGTIPVFYNPLTNQPFFTDLQVKLDYEFQDLEFGGHATSIEFNQDSCGFIVRAFGGHGGIIGKFDLTIAYRDSLIRPECSLPKPEKYKLPTKDDYSTYAPIPNDKCPSQIYLLIPGYRYSYISYAEDKGKPLPDTSLTVNYTLESIEDLLESSGRVITTVLVRVKIIQRGAHVIKARNSRPIDAQTIEYHLFVGGTIAGNHYSPESIWTTEKEYTCTTIWNYSRHEYTYSENVNATLPNGQIISYYQGGEVSFIGATYEEFSDDPDRPKNSKISTYYSSNQLFTVEERQVKIQSICDKAYPYVPPQPPPPPPEKDCCRMSCCPDVQQNDQLLRLILKRIGTPTTVQIFDENLDRKGAQKANKTPQSLNEYLKLAVERTEITSRVVGIENFPVTVPDTVIEPHKEGAFAKIFGFINGEKERKIKTVTEFIAWQAEQDSAVLGEFHQVIEFDSEERGKDGKPKKKTVVLPNVAETLKEITLLVAQMAKQNNIQTEVLLKVIAETLATRAEATKGTAIVEDIQDYLDYPTKTKTIPMKTSVTIPNFEVDKNGKAITTEALENTNNFLKPGKVKVVHESWTGNSSLHDQLLDFLQVASMIRATHYKRTDTNAG